MPHSLRLDLEETQFNGEKVKQPWKIMRTCWETSNQDAAPRAVGRREEQTYQVVSDYQLPQAVATIRYRMRLGYANR